VALPEVVGGGVLVIARSIRTTCDISTIPKARCQAIARLSERNCKLSRRSLTSLK
jgi:hypothetical protein